MKFIAGLLLLLWAGTGPAVKPEMRYFRYQRQLENMPATVGQTCVALDPAIFAHAAPQLADVRLYRGETETPFVIHVAEPAGDSNQPVALLNLGQRAGQTVFDAAMPAGSYGDIQLSITGQDFLATATVTGSQAQSGAAQTKLGSYTIFDLTRQKLGRSTVLHLPTSDFRFLHFRIDGPIKPDDVTGLTVMRMATDQPKYLAVASTALAVRRGRETAMEFAVSAHTPVDRVVVVPGAQPANFSRDVRIRVTSIAPPKTDTGETASLVETSGNLMRVHRVEDGHAINEEHLSVDAPHLTADEATHWTVTIENGDDPPIALSSMRLEMMERDLCFDVAAGAAYTLEYGDAALSAPQYDYASFFTLQKDAARATSGPEAANPVYEARPDMRPFTERHPILLWAALGAVIVLLGAITLRSAKRPAAPAKP